MNRIKFLVDTLDQTRKYTLNVLDRIPQADWLKQPREGVTHTAWQVGHLAVAEFRLCLGIVRGDLPGDDKILPPAYLELYGRTSIPDPSSDSNPSTDELRSTLDNVHKIVMKELSEFDESILDEPSPREHPMFTTKFGAILWASQHEFNHAGQISLIRRLLGGEFTW